MKDALLILTIFCTIAGGYFLMGRLDRFLSEGRSAITQPHEQHQPACLLLTDELPDEELLREIRAFRSTHAHMRIMLCDSAGTAAPGEKP